MQRCSLILIQWIKMTLLLNLFCSLLMEREINMKWVKQPDRGNAFVISGAVFAVLVSVRRVGYSFPLWPHWNMKRTHWAGNTRRYSLGLWDDLCWMIQLAVSEHYNGGSKMQVSSRADLHAQYSNTDGSGPGCPSLWVLWIQGHMCPWSDHSKAVLKEQLCGLRKRRDDEFIPPMATARNDIPANNSSLLPPGVVSQTAAHFLPPPYVT